MSFTNKSYDHLFKLLLIGDSGVGKSAIIARFSDDAFNSNFISTIGIDFKIKTIDLKGKRIKLQIWDTAGQERFHTITTSYYRAAMGIILVYDVTNLQTFENISKWLRNIEVHASEDAEKIILGNKCDADEQRVVPKQRGEAIAAEYGVKFLETSAKNDVSIEEAFYYLAGAILTKTMERNDNENRQRDFPRRSNQQARNRAHDRRSVGFNLKSETNSNSSSEPNPKPNPKSSKCC